MVSIRWPVNQRDNCTVFDCLVCPSCFHGLCYAIACWLCAIIYVNRWLIQLIVCQCSPGVSKQTRPAVTAFNFPATNVLLSYQTSWDIHYSISTYSWGTSDRDFTCPVVLLDHGPSRWNLVANMYTSWDMRKGIWVFTSLQSINCFLYFIA